jgi:hypothetical protein
VDLIFRRALARAVDAVPALRNDPFEPGGERRRVERVAVGFGVDELDVRRRQQALREIAPARDVGGLPHVEPGEVQQVEAVEDARCGAVGGSDLAQGLELGPILKRVEGRAAVPAERDDLAVEDHAVHRLLRQLGRDGREKEGEIEPTARAELDPIALDEGENAIAVELRLVHPVRVGGQRIARLGEHR